ncbi:hypothetical protein [Nitratireductor indicus]|nr:hypothetical protein [Nitratireductor indicus]MDS1138783.1 hypothetical protein [Nitratireductor indicus]
MGYQLSELAVLILKLLLTSIAYDLGMGVVLARYTFEARAVMTDV